MFAFEDGTVYLPPYHPIIFSFFFAFNSHIYVVVSYACRRMRSVCGVCPCAGLLAAVLAAPTALSVGYPCGTSPQGWKGCEPSRCTRYHRTRTSRTPTPFYICVCCSYIYCISKQHPENVDIQNHQKNQNQNRRPLYNVAKKT